MADLTFVASDDQPSIFGTLAVAGVVLDLTGATTVYFEMRPAIDRRLSVNDLAQSSLRRRWGRFVTTGAPGQLLDPGNYVMRWRVNWSDGSTQHSDPENTITVESE